MDNFFVKDESGKPIFTGKEDPANPPVKPSFQSSKMLCGVCGNEVDYLVGENTQDGGVQGCEGCWKPGKNPPAKGVDEYDKDKEIL